MYKKIILTAMLMATVLQGKAADANYNVIPLPQKIALVKGKAFELQKNVVITCISNDELMQKNAEFLSAYINEMTGIRLQVSKTLQKKAATIELRLDSKINGNEAYNITVTNKKVIISGKTSAGVFYGIQTLRKSLPLDLPENEAIYLPAGTIQDSPRFGYRGMMLDCSRHFFSMDFVKRYIDLIALHNMNVFHWHLTDDQGWRIEIKKYPKLTEIGSVRSGTVMGCNSDVDDDQPVSGYYTQEEARQIVEYARQRHITVIPEVDMPGHMRALLAAYPQYGCTGGPYTVGHKWGVYEDVLCLGTPEMYNIVEDILDELISIFPSKYIHIGGDETPTKRWEACEKCQKLMKTEGLEPKKFQAYFTNRIEKYLNNKGRSIIGWDEILDGDINQSATIMSWRGIEPGERGAKLGHDVIMTPVDYCYLDYKQSDDNWVEPKAPGHVITPEKIYEMDPAPEKMAEKERKHIIGTQGNLWTEYIKYPSRAEYGVLPRMAALAEVAWVERAKMNYTDFKARSYHLAKIYDKYGYHYALQMWEERYNHQRFIN